MIKLKLLQNDKNQKSRYLNKTLNTTHKSTEIKFWLQFEEHLHSFLGYTYHEFSSKTWTELTYANDHKAKSILFKPVIKGMFETYALERQFIHKNGQIVLVSVDIKCSKNSQGMLEYLAMAITGSSGTMLEHCRLGLLITDTNGDVILVSEAFTQGKRMKILNMASKS